MSTCTTLPVRLDLTAYQGATFTEELIWKTGATPTPVNLTGYTAEMKVKVGQTTILTLANGSGITLGGAAGTIVLTISADDTAALAPANAEYDLILTSGAVATALVRGMFLVRKGITG